MVVVEVDVGGVAAVGWGGQWVEAVEVVVGEVEVVVVGVGWGGQWVEVVEVVVGEVVVGGMGWAVGGMGWAVGGGCGGG